MSFLKAEWRKLAIVNYEIDPEVLKPYLPSQTELDFWDGKCYVSLVGFMFRNTRLFGMRIPYHTDFEEVNLRFYVKRKVNGEWRRGVVFVREIVPRPTLTLVANLVYNENYQTMTIGHSWSESIDHRSVEYRWKKREHWHSIKIWSDLHPAEIEKDSEMEFVMEHYWGYARINDRKSNEYEVKHPRWSAYRVRQSEIAVDFREVYGDQFAFMNDTVPVSVMLAEGSEITVERKKLIRPESFHEGDELIAAHTPHIGNNS